MPRTAKTSASPLDSLPGLMGWAEQLGHMFGQGVARGLNGALAEVENLASRASKVRPGFIRTGKPGRPAKIFTGVVPAGKRCSVSACPNPARSKGLCSKHYQAARRKRMAKA